MIEELDRRSVYRDDVEFTPHVPSGHVRGDGYRLLPKIRELYGRGMSQLDISIELELGLCTVGRLIRQYKVPKGKKVG